MIYFIQGEDTRRVKIGYNKNPSERLEQIQSSEKLRLLCVVPNSNISTKKFLHKKFEQARCIGEWFEESPELVDYIDVMRLKRSRLLLLESMHGASKGDHKYWSWFGDETFAFNIANSSTESTLHLEGSYADTEFPDGMWDIIGWEDFEWADQKYYHVLAYCTERTTDDGYKLVVAHKSIFVNLPEYMEDPYFCLHTYHSSPKLYLYLQSCANRLEKRIYGECKGKNPVICFDPI